MYLADVLFVHDERPAFDELVVPGVDDDDFWLMRMNRLSDFVIPNRVPSDIERLFRSMGENNTAHETGHF